MCSIAADSPEGTVPDSRAEQRIAEIGQAINDLANMTGVNDPGDTEPIVARVAELWRLLADLDPEVARRLAGYQALSAVPTRSE
jgi:hypothetical protein